MEQSIINIVDIIQKIGLVGVLIILAVPQLRAKIFGNGNGEITELKNQISTLQTNHLRHLEEKIDKLTEKEDEGNLISKEILLILKDIRDSKKL